MAAPRILIEQTKSFLSIRRHFGNPWLILFSKLGLIELPYFAYRIAKGPCSYVMLGRPTTTSMADLFVLREVLLREVYRDILPLLGPGPLRIVDVGANLGSFTIWLHRRVGLREAFCFEPQPDSCLLLAFNLSRNDCDVAKVIRAAAGGRARTVQMSPRPDSPGGANIYGPVGRPRGDYRAETVSVVAFEEWARSVPGDFDVLKLDCEGSEWEIVRQTSAQLWSRFRVVVAEVHGDPESNRPCDEFRQMIEAKGIRTVRWDGHPAGLYIGLKSEAG